MNTLKKGIAALALVAASTIAAQAQVSFAYAHCSGGLCFAVVDLNRQPRGQLLERDPGAPARIKKWEVFCEPHVVTDRDGIERYTYAHKGCENGRSE